MANMLYNGVELPALPEWDKTKYPYAHFGARDFNDIYGSDIGLDYNGLLLSDFSVTFSSIPPTYNESSMVDGNSNITLVEWVGLKGACEYQVASIIYNITDASKEAILSMGITEEELAGMMNWSFSEVISNTNPDAGAALYLVDENADSGSGPIVWCNADVMSNKDGSLYLAASEPVPVGNPHITTSSGNGFALYDHFLLADIGDKWDSSVHPNAMIGIISGARYGYSGANGYVFAATDGNISVDGSNIDIEPKFGKSAMYCFMTDNAAFNQFVVNNTTFEPLVNEWGSVEVTSSHTSITLGFTGLWSNFAMDDNTENPYYSSTYYPLDGMTLIEWDGDTTGLVGNDSSFYIVSPYVDPIEGYAVFKYSDGYHYVADIVERSTYGSLSWYMQSSDPFFIPVMGSEEQNAVTFVNAKSQDNNQQIVNYLFAYRSVESPPDDGGGDESTAQKHYCRVNGSVHEVEGGTARVNGSYHEIEVGTVRIEGAYYEIPFSGGSEGGGDEGGGSLDGVIFQAGEGLLQGTVTATPNNPSFTTVISYSVTDSYITTTGGNVQQTVGGNTVYIPAFYTLTIGPFDATDFDTLHVELTSNIGVVKCESGTDSVASGVITNSATAEEVTLDISGLSGECNVVIAPSSSITSSTIFNATIYKIWLT